MECVILLNNMVLLSYPIMFSYDIMKASQRRTTSFRTLLSTSEGVMALSFIHDDRAAQLDVLSVVAIVAFVPSPASKLSTTIHHLPYTASIEVIK